MPPAGPFPPFDAWPVQRFEPRYGYMWFVPPATVVDQVIVEHATGDTVRAMHATLDALLAAEGARIEAAGGLVIIGDWRRLRSYTPEARRVFMERMRARPKKLVHTGVTVLAQVNPLLRMAVQAGGMILAVAGAAKVEVFDDIDAALAAHRVVAPPKDLKFPGR
jgi:hypothetical protein